jgi:hypothetical protein
VIVVRPDPVDDNSPNLCLEITYFLDGAYRNQNAYFFTVDLDLLPFEHTDLNSDCPQISYRPMDIFSRSPLPLCHKLLEWTHECQSYHSECNGKLTFGATTVEHGPLPTRLLDVGDWPVDTPFLRLCLTANINRDTKYTTLSHCWGTKVHASLRNENYKQFLNCIPCTELSKTFLEAIQFTRQLGIRYIWIDSLCIAQDSKEDWIHEALLMGSTYSKSFLNLAATSSKDGDEGLFHSYNPLIVNPCHIQADWTGLPSGKYMCLDDGAWPRRIEDGPLNQRAWVLQERLLSPRTVHFAYDQIWWECSCHRASESFRDGVPEERFRVQMAAVTAFQEIKMQNMTITSFNDFWLAIVRAYSECHLTKDEDKLTALAGVASSVQTFLQLSQDDYLTGLWRHGLRKDLLWRMANVGRRFDTYQAPSWSWASVDGAVHFNNSGDLTADGTPGRDFAVNILEARVERNQGSAFGPVRGGRIILAGPLCSVKLGGLSYEQLDDPVFKTATIHQRHFVANETFTEVLDHEPTYQQGSSGRHLAAYFCRFITSDKTALNYSYVSEGLLLERTAGERGEFRRIGWMRVFHDDAEEEFDVSSEGAKLQTVDYIDQDGPGRYIIKII